MRKGTAKVVKKMEHIAHVFYINMDDRPDRRSETEAELARAGIPSEKITRVSGVPDAIPDVGCCIAHMHAVKAALDQNVSNALIVEDDFNFIDDLDQVNRGLNHLFAIQTPWRIAMLARIITEAHDYDDVLLRAIQCTNAAGYILNGRETMQLFHGLLRDSVEPLRSTRMHWIYANDRIWVEIMRRELCFCFRERLGYQRISPSSINAGYVRDVII